MQEGLCISASGNFLANENLLKVINKNVCYLHSVWISQIN